jgi:hypothetical protein
VTEAREDGFGHVIRHLFTTIGPCRGTVCAGGELVYYDDTLAAFAWETGVDYHHS